MTYTIGIEEDGNNVKHYGEKIKNILAKKYKVSKAHVSGGETIVGDAYVGGGLQAIDVCAPIYTDFDVITDDDKETVMNEVRNAAANMNVTLYIKKDGCFTYIPEKTTIPEIKKVMIVSLIWKDAKKDGPMVSCALNKVPVAAFKINDTEKQRYKEWYNKVNIHELAASIPRFQDRLMFTSFEVKKDIDPIDGSETFIITTEDGDEYHIILLCEETCLL